MFTEFTSIKGSLFKERVNTWLGIVFISTCALWAAIFMWNVSTGDNPIDHSIAAAIDQEIIGPQN